MTFKWITVLVFVCAFSNLFAQHNTFSVYAGYEPSGDHVSADFTLGASYTRTINDWLYVSTFIRLGHGSVLHGSFFPDNPENYAGKFQSYVFGNSVSHEVVRSGLKRYVSDSELVTIIHGYQIGVHGALGSIKVFAGAGVSIGYMDYQTLGEAGDAIFEFEGQEYLLWYSIPAYQRGLGLQWSFSSGIEHHWKEWFVGIRGDADLGGFGKFALGNRISLALSFGKQF